MKWPFSLAFVFSLFVATLGLEGGGLHNKSIKSAHSSRDVTGAPSSQRDFAMHNYYVVRKFNGEKS